MKIGLSLSAIIHLFILFLFFDIQKNSIKTTSYNRNNLARSAVFKIETKDKKREETKPETPVKTTANKIKRVKRAPASHIKKEAKSVEEVKPVFGVTKKSVDEKMTAGIGVRVGNTLMKEMEKEYTAPEKIRDYAGGKNLEERAAKSDDKFYPTALSKIATMPKVINPKRPNYPKSLEEEEFEGEVVLELSISKRGEVIKIRAVESDHELFSESAIKTVKNYKFKPAKLADGTSVDAIIEFTIKFEMPL